LDSKVWKKRKNMRKIKIKNIFCKEKSEKLFVFRSVWYPKKRLIQAKKRCFTGGGE